MGNRLLLPFGSCGGKPNKLVVDEALNAERRRGGREDEEPSVAVVEAAKTLAGSDDELPMDGG
jgi:hypothetical protein